MKNQINIMQPGLADGIGSEIHEDEVHSPDEKSEEDYDVH